MERTKDKPGFHWAAAWAVAAVAFCAAAVFVVRACVRAPGDAVATVGSEVRETAETAAAELIRVGRAAAAAVSGALTAGPEVVVENRTIIGQSEAVAEYAAVTREFDTERSFESTFLGSTKRLHMRGTFRAKAGFDLGKRFRVTVEPGRLVVALPAPRILSVEMTGYRTLEDADGLWNKVKTEERDREIQALLAEARLRASRGMGLEKLAAEEAARRLKEILVPLAGRPVEVVIEEPGEAEEREGPPGPAGQETVLPAQ